MDITKAKNSKSIIVAAIIAAATFFYVFTGEDYLSLFENGSGESIEKKDIDSEVYSVTHIVDGDTFDISSGERVRMIGIDTPERGEEYYSEAKDYLKDLIYEKDVRLEMDVSETDRYGRLLRHVYVGDEWINKKMISDGYARFVTYPPDVGHVDVFASLEKKARESDKGLWSIYDK